MHARRWGRGRAGRGGGGAGGEVGERGGGTPVAQEAAVSVLLELGARSSERRRAIREDPSGALEAAEGLGRSSADRNVVVRVSAVLHCTVLSV